MEGETTANIKLKVMEQIIAQYDPHKSANMVQSILAETKVGARREPNLPSILKTILTTN